MAKSAFKQEHPFENRQAQATRIREKHPNGIPVIIEKHWNSDVPDIERKKYLTPDNLTVGRFLYVIRQRLKPSAEKDVFLFVKNVLPPTVALMSEIYHKHKDEDGFLYMTYNEMAKSAFKQEYPFEWRRGENIRIREKYPDRIPVIVEKHQNSDLPDIKKKKYLVPGNICVGKFAYVIRQQIKLSAEKALFLFVENVLPPTRSFKQFLKAFIACKIKNSVCSSDSLYICDTAALMSEIYHKHKDEDGFLYVTYSGKKTLGSS